MPFRKTTLIYNGRELKVDWAQNDIIPRIEGRYNLVSIGHLSKVKNHKLLCGAVDRLVKYGAPIELYMFGRFADNDIVDSIRALNNPHIHLLGEIPTPRIYLRNADAFCMSSVIEGMPISLIEALSCGLIPICTAVGGIVDMIDDGKIGFLSYDMTTESYVKTIERFLELDAEKMAIMKRLCQQSAQQYSIEECAHRYEELFSL